MNDELEDRMIKASFVSGSSFGAFTVVFLNYFSIPPIYAAIVVSMVLSLILTIHFLSRKWGT